MAVECRVVSKPKQSLRGLREYSRGVIAISPELSSTTRINADVQLFGDANKAFWFRLPADAAGRKVRGLKEEIRTPLAKLGKIALRPGGSIRRKRSSHFTEGPASSSIVFSKSIVDAAT